MTKKNILNKVLILGSGALKIGEAGEFDYSGSQAIKALKEEGIKTILVNPNIATIQTSKEFANDVYFLPVTPYFVEKIIKKEKPDAILLSFGGQTALNCGMELHNLGVLKKYSVRILGTPIHAIELTEDRQEFANHLKKIGIITPLSYSATTTKDAILAAKKIGFPIMIRAGFALGGQGSGVARTMDELETIVHRSLALSPQVLIEQYLHHFKEIEYEVVRDEYDNCVTVCNMENMDPLGIHTGDSIVVAPSQTLTNEEYHTLRKISIEIVRGLGIIGECNVQYALNPNPKNGELDYYVIEVNARLSRSSALASKATGYPLAYVAAKLALGYNLSEIQNKVTQVTQACFEPALDYIVVKIPRWDLDKFKGAAQQLGSGMKSVGEVMGIGRTFEEAYQKAIRMLDVDYEGALPEDDKKDLKRLKESVATATPKRPFDIALSLKAGIPVSTLHKLSGIDPWFLHRIKQIVEQEQKITNAKKLDAELLLESKQLGMSDKRIGLLRNKTGLEIRAIRHKLNIRPAVLQIDTLAAEFPAKTNYLYMTYNASHNDISSSGKDSVIVLGSGPYHIGSSVEFDWCCVNTAVRLKKHKKKSIIINCNPETVSTDYDISDRLYFEELTFERIADIYEFENPQGIIVSVGGQTPNNRAKALNNYGMVLLGTKPDDIDRAEDRSKFSALLDKLNVKQPEWQTFTTFKAAEKFSQKTGYPVLIRPSYVLSGSAMAICFTKEELTKYLTKAVKISNEYPVIVSKFFMNAKEVELDAVAQKGKIKASIISEHIENAGVHSGDATIVLPHQSIQKETEKRMREISEKLAQELDITGPFNIQFLLKENEVYIIEINLRASRTFPFIAKVTGINMISLFVDSLFQTNVPTKKTPSLTFTAVKVAQFSFSRITGAMPQIGVEMSSTGEVACFGKNLEEAYLKGLLATNAKIPTKGIFVSLGGDKKKQDFLQAAKLLPKLNVPLYATEKTSQFLATHGIKTTMIHKAWEKSSPNIIDYLQKDKIDFVMNIVETKMTKDLQDAYQIRRIAADRNILILSKIKKAELYIKALVNTGLDKLEIKPWSEYK